MPTAPQLAVLTPPGTGAIGVLALRGSASWSVVRSLFTPVRGPLPEQPVPGRLWFGSIGAGVSDEVVVTVPTEAPDTVEIHCHGGRQVIAWLVELFESRGCSSVTWQDWLTHFADRRERLTQLALVELAHAPTVRTASILLDQVNGAYADALDDPESFKQLAKWANLGRHLTRPWRVVIAGAPNVGKSSLVNALAGYQRSVVAPVPGTTRDVVTIRLAFDGWPIELADTAGLRAGQEALEQAGIEQAREAVAEADLIVWLLDATTEPVWPELDAATVGAILFVANKCDEPSIWTDERVTLCVSARTGQGVKELSERIAQTLVPNVPLPGTAVPFTPELADAAERVR